MSLMEDFYTKLTGTAAITSLVSTRIYQNYIPAHAVLPYIVFGRNGKESEMGLSGDKLLAKTSIAVECCASDPDSAEDLADVVETALDGVTGTWGSSTIRGAFVKDTDDDYTPFPRGSDQGEHVVGQVVNVHHVTA